MKEEIYEFLKEWRDFSTAKVIHSKFQNLSLCQIQSICRQLKNEGRVRRWWHRNSWHYQFLS